MVLENNFYKEKNMKLKLLDLFSGIGGFSLGLESTGFFETIAFVEKDKFCQKVLKKNFNNIPIEEDIRNVKGSNYKADVITGGFPCQPFSIAGKEKEQMMIATSGMKLLELSKNVNLNGSLGKMLKVLLTSTKAWSSDRCKMIWKEKVSKSNVSLFQLQVSVHGIKGKESGSLDAMYPTPTTMDHIDRKGMRPSRAATNRKSGYLSEMIKMYPTPTSVQRPNEGNMRMMRKQVLQGNISREEASAMGGGKDVFKAHGKVKMYNTPTTNDHRI